MFIYSDTLALLKVRLANAEGYDLDGAPFVFGRHLCQRLAVRTSIYEYDCATGFYPEEFFECVHRFELAGYLAMYAPVDWNGMAFQWMARPTGRTVGLRGESVTVTHPFSIVLNAVPFLMAGGVA